jgi:N-acetylglutamate synthase-like GNAT family acetyltransferase
MIEIAPYTAPYREGVATLILGIQRDEFGFQVTYDDQPDLKEIENFYQSGAGGFWLALEDRRVVGTIGLRDIGDDGALRKMFVASERRGAEHRVGQRLLDTLLAHARARRLSAVWLGTTEKFLAAHRFYEKNGFERVAPETLPPSFPRMRVDTRFYRLRLEDPAP